MSAEQERREEDFVPVHQVPDEATATMLRDFLEGQGIRAAVVSAQIPWLGTIEAMRKGYWGRIEVLEHDAKQARALIADFYAARPEPDASIQPEEPEGGR